MTWKIFFGVAVSSLLRFWYVNLKIKKINSKISHIFWVCIVFALTNTDIGYGQKLSDEPIIVIEQSKAVKIQTKKFTRISGYINVPENRNSDNARNIQLPVVIYKSTHPKPLEPVFKLSGGPGESNIPKTISNADLLKNHDFVFVGYRGVDGSTQLKSKKLAKAVKGINHQLLSDASLDNIEKTAKEYLEELKRDGIDISAYTLMDVIEDMEYTRKALGYDKINLLSESYGTRVALIYSYKYPEVIHRTVMNGANPPGHFLWYPQKTEEILTKWDSIYKSNNKGSIKEAMHKSFENMPEKWSVFKLDRDKIKTGTFVFLFSTEMAVMAFDSYIKAAEVGDYSGLFLIQKAYDIYVPRNNWGDMFQKGFSADFDSEMNYREYLRSFDESTILGSNNALLLWGSSGTWHSEPIPKEYQKLRPSDTETLILSGELDVSTPADFATEKLLPYMNNSQQIVFKNMSHIDVANAQPENYRKVINEFFHSGSVNTTAYEPQSISFKPKYKLYRLAKWGFPIIVSFLTLIIFFSIKYLTLTIKKCRIEKKK
jgi:pimeloyl-ACP methyl ester carboxylesterase